MHKKKLEILNLTRLNLIFYYFKITKVIFSATPSKRVKFSHVEHKIYERCIGYVTPRKRIELGKNIHD